MIEITEVKNLVRLFQLGQSYGSNQHDHTHGGTKFQARDSSSFILITPPPHCPHTILQTYVQTVQT
jgi:hypothetical protein